MVRARVAMVVALVAVLLSVGGVDNPADALGARVCNGTGKIVFDVHEDGSAALTASGGGACSVHVADRLRIVSLTGTGSASSLGLCSGDLVASDLVLEVTITAFDPLGGSQEEHYTWSASVTTFPVATPVIITGDGFGASLILTHIFLNCGQDGTRPTASFNWLQTT